MEEKDYSNREIDRMIGEVTEHLSSQDKKLDKILVQTTEHNHRMTKMERVIIVLFTVIVVLLITNGSKFVDFISTITK